MRPATTTPGICNAARSSIWAAPAILAVRLLVLGTVACGVFAQVLVAQARPSEDDVKAAYLFNFGKFVREPEAITPPVEFVICVLGRDAILPVLERITLHEQIDNRRVQVRHYDKAAEARGCAIVYLSRSETERMDEDLAALQGAHALTVGDDPQFLAHGGMLQFVLQKDRVRFAVNLEAVSRGELHLSSELLRVAAWVSGAPRAEVPR
jgi:hypothetical protein